MTRSSSASTRAVDARRPATLVWWAAALSAAYILMGALISLDVEQPWTQGVDDAWRSMVGASPDSSAYLGAVPMFFQHLGEVGQLAIGVVLPITLAVIGRWRSALFVFTTYLVAQGVYAYVGKYVVDRPRPAEDEAQALFGPLFPTDHGSFPSGHATFAAASVLIVLALIPRPLTRLRRAWIAVGVIVMIGMAWQRTLINAHWLSDTISGLVAGTAAVLLMWWAFWPLLRRDEGRPLRLFGRARRVEERQISPA